jgi:NAD/NADP transhydrogenase alpha subunit
LLIEQIKKNNLIVMNKTLAIRHEDKYLMERRSAITPMHVKDLVNKGFKVLVETSKKRVFKDAEYEAASAIIVDNVSDSPVVFWCKRNAIKHF